MLFNNFGFFSRTDAVAGVAIFTNEDGEDFYDVVRSISDREGPYVFTSIYGTWVTLNEDKSVRNVYADPSALVPDDAYFYGLDCDPEDVETGMIWDEATASFLPAPPPVLTTLALNCNAVFQIADGMVTGEVSQGFAFIMPVGPGSYLAFFLNEHPDLRYVCTVGASSGQINVTGRYTTHVEIAATENGVPTDPAEISLRVERI